MLLISREINDVKARIALNLTQLWLSNRDLAYFWNKPNRIETGRKIGF